MISTAIFITPSRMVPMKRRNLFVPGTFQISKRLFAQAHETKSARTYLARTKIFSIWPSHGDRASRVYKNGHSYEFFGFFELSPRAGNRKSPETVQFGPTR